MKWLHAETVAHQQQLSLERIPKGKSKHSPQLLHACRPVLFVEVKNDLCVGIGLKLMSLTFQIGPQFEEVIDLTIKDDPDSAVFVAHGIAAAFRQVDYGQATMAQAHISADKRPTIVWTAMSHRVGHALYGLRVNPARRVEI